MRHQYLFYFFIVFSVLADATFAQQNTLRGRVIDIQTNEPVPFAFITIQRLNQGAIADGNGFFEVKTLSTDTLIISSMGFNVKKLSASVVLAPGAELLIKLTRKNIQLNSVVIVAPKNFEEVQKDLKSITPYKYQVNGLGSAAASPITYLYERFSREGKSLRKVQELTNNDTRLTAMTLLIKSYINKGIFKLEDNEIEGFIAYCNLPDFFVINASEYDLLMELKRCYRKYCF